MRHLYIKKGQINKGFQPQIQFCRHQKGELIEETNEIMGRWREYFADLLNGPDNEEQEQKTTDYYGT